MTEVAATICSLVVPGLQILADVLVALIGGVEEFAISRRRLFADGEGAMNLRRVAPVADRQLGDDDAAFFEHA